MNIKSSDKKVPRLSRLSYLQIKETKLLLTLKNRKQIKPERERYYLLIVNVVNLDLGFQVHAQCI